MASVGAFNDMLSQFLSELIQTFPEEKSIKKYESAFDLLRKSNPRKVVENFMGTIAPLQERIMAKDETVLTSENLKSLNELNLAKNWDGASENTRSCIWQYLQTLLMLGMTITALPADTLAAIEGVAEKTAGQIASGEQSEGDLMKMLGGLLGNLQK
jgi:hypothetical protein|tara:strand:+ start:200 stop:670 length:471 start_codon:yes stop_codon:yes gene_type:complete